MLLRRAFALSVVLLVGCNTDPVPTPGTADTAPSEDTSDISALDTGSDSGGVDIPSTDVDEEDVVPDVPEADADVRDASSCDALGCPCNSDSDCASELCVPFGDGLGICSEFCDGACSEPGYACEPFNLDGREVLACFLIDTYCAPCADVPGCGASANVCLSFEDGAFCATTCEIHGYCPRGATCTSVRQGDETLAVCTPDSGVCAPCVDPDSDGYGIGAECRGSDCNQSNPSAYDGAPELCDGVDNDCDLEMDEDYNLLTDVRHCGGCGVVCDIENAAADCVDGVCEIGACLEGFDDCNEDPEDGCETDLASAELCGACGPLDGLPGETCGTCGSGTWTCNDDGGLDCIGDLGDDARNECGGCDPLDGEPGTECADCSTWACGADGGVTCEVLEDEINACGGCGPIEAEPETPCGTCGSGAWTCDDDGGIACVGDLGPDARNDCGGCDPLDGEPGTVCAPCSAWTCDGAGGVTCELVDGDVNACGGCGPLEAAPGTPCGSCGLGTWTCGEDGVFCDGGSDEERNACGGCATLEAEPETTCGPCGLDAWACDGTDGVACDGETSLNDCGGCGELVAEIGSPCGTCDAGAWACDGRESVECIGGGDDARNLCGGCGLLEEAPGAPCGPCDDGLVICNGIEATRCIEATPDPDGDGVCGDDDVCPGGDDRADADFDGIPDACDDCPLDDPGDTDSDGVCDSDDICEGSDDAVDGDGDGVPDGCDECPLDNPDDSDGDGVCDADDACPGFLDSLDEDGDGAPDLCDVCPGSDDSVDDDVDGVPNGCDICAAGDDAVDTDGDETPDACDLCPGGDDRTDVDGNGVPDACDTGTITPGSSTVAEVSGFAVRCLEWSGDRCTHLQQRGACDVCSAYANCDDWHNTTMYNNGSNRTAINWCFIATGNPGVVAVSPGGPAAFPAGCGWSSSSHPICEAGRMSIVMPDPAIPSTLGLLMNPTYCDDDPTLMTLECEGW